jgi:hypothetical protein
MASLEIVARLWTSSSSGEKVSWDDGREISLRVVCMVSRRLCLITLLKTIRIYDVFYQVAVPL